MGVKNPNPGVHLGYFRLRQHSNKYRVCDAFVGNPSTLLQYRALYTSRSAYWGMRSRELLGSPTLQEKSGINSVSSLDGWTVGKLDGCGTSDLHRTGLELGPKGPEWWMESCLLAELRT